MYKGGWRAMFADVGFANAFQQAGLLSGNSSLFTGIVSNSTHDLRQYDWTSNTVVLVTVA
jgi:hypothetical protein